MSPSTRLARDVVTALVTHGVTEVVLAPGSRNAPLSFAVHDAAAAGLLRLHTRVDERSAAFTALGMTRVGAFYVDKIKSAADGFTRGFPSVRLLLAELGTDAGVIGAAVVAARELSAVAGPSAVA